MSSTRREGPPVPQPVTAVIRSLKHAGHSAWLVGESLHGLARGALPIAFEVATSLPPDECLHRHANAVPTRLEDAIITIPTAAGPLDVSPFRNGKEVEADLPFRDFTVNAMAFDPTEQHWLDPFDGRGDLARKLLRGVRSAPARLAEDPLRSLRAARLCGQLGYTPDAELVLAMREGAASLRKPSGMRRRWELSRIVREPGAEAALALLYETGVLQVLFPGVRQEALTQLEALPPDLGTRLAFLLRGTRSAGALRRLGFGRITASRVQHLLQHHPLEAQVKPGAENALRRLLRRVDAPDRSALESMRELELAALPSAEAEAARARFEGLRDAIAHIAQADSAAAERPPLALGGRDVMETLACSPGPIIGEALGFLARRAAEDPARNSRDALRAELLAWARERDSK
jgi:tRNA nucleotidyltransferase/poly(A) polymerase